MRIGSSSGMGRAPLGTPRVAKATEHFDPSRQGRAVTKLAERETLAAKQVSTPPLDPAVEQMLAKKGIYPSRK